MKTEQVALILKQLYEETYGGKQTGRYKITREDFKRLAQRDKLEADFITSVIAVPKILGWRTVPARLIL
ncbi:MAG TPA: hypothetical protein VFF81_11580 [Noviherbaspirillum sp.]|nr:hypothetical protein [Noviherbaspirillum sp.]